MEAALKMLQHNLRQKEEQLEAAKLRVKTLTSERGEIIQLIETMSKYSGCSSSNPAAAEAAEKPKSWADQVEEDENLQKEPEVRTDPIDKFFGKQKGYVIFDGPMAGVYTN